MRAKSLALLALALTCGVVASLGVTQVMARRNTDSSSSIETKTVYVAAKDISQGTLLTDALIKAEEWPKDSTPAGALGAKEEIDGRRTRTKIYAGEPILEPKLFGKGTTDQGADALIPKGYRVISVRVDPVTVHGGLLLPGSRVDLQVYFAKNDGLGVKETTTRTILQNVKVFAVNDVVSMDASSPEAKSIAGRTVSLLVTPREAEKVTLASEMGTVRLVMRSPDDDAQTTTRGAVARDMFNAGDSPTRQKEQTAQSDDSGKKFAEYLASIQAKLAASKAAAPPPPPLQYVMRLLKGTKVNDVVFEQQRSAFASSSDNTNWKVSGPTPPPPKADIDVPGLGGLDLGKDLVKPSKTTPPSGTDATPPPTSSNPG